MSCECGSHLPDMGIKALREYVRLHIISLEQDLDKHRPEDTLLVEYIEGQIEVSKHYLEVMEGYDD